MQRVRSANTDVNEKMSSSARKLKRIKQLRLICRIGSDKLKRHKRLRMITITTKTR